MNFVHSVTLGVVIFAAQSTLAADADSGKRQAQQHCSPCHPGPASLVQPPLKWRSAMHSKRTRADDRSITSSESVG